MKKTLFTLFTAINLVLLYCPAALALTEDEAAAAVDAQGKDAVSGNLFLWLLCAIAFLKVSTKLDGILHSLGIGVSRSPGSMLSEALLAFRGFEIGKAFIGLGAAKAAAATTNTKTTPSNTFAGGLSGVVSRHVQQSTASSISGQSGGIGASLGGSMYHNSLGKDGGFASKVIGSIATGQTGGSITGDSAVEALNGYFASTSDAEAMPIPATGENIPTAMATAENDAVIDSPIHATPLAWRAIAQLMFLRQGIVKLPCAPVAVPLLWNRPPFPLRLLSNRQL